MIKREEWTNDFDVPQTHFSVPIDELVANRSYTFCFRAMEALSAADSAEFVALAANGIRPILQGTDGITTAPVGASRLRELHSALRAALPKRAVEIPSSSLLREAPIAPPVAAAQAQIDQYNASQARLDTAVFRSFVEFNDIINGRGRAGEFLMSNSSSVPTKVPRLDPLFTDTTVKCLATGIVQGTAKSWSEVCNSPVGWLLLRVAGDPILSKLSESIRLFGPPAKPESPAALQKAFTDRMAEASILARRLKILVGDPTLVEAVAVGMTTVVQLRQPVDGNPKPLAEKASRLSEWGTNLDTSAARIDDLRELLAFLRTDAAARAALKIDTTRAGTLDSLLRVTKQAIITQRVTLGDLVRHTTDLESKVQAVVKGLAGRELKHYGLAATTSASYEVRARWYVGQDIGVIYGQRGQEVKQASPYLGINVYLAPVNKRAPKPLLCVFDLRCTSISVGVPTNNWEQENRYSGILAGRPLVLGVGTRIGDFTRLSYNRALVYSYAFPPQGRIRKLNSIGAMSLTLDVDLREVISGIANAIFPK